MIDEFQVSAGDPNVADTSTRETIIGPINQPESNHNGGMIAFGPDGMLYIGMGDGGGGGDVHGSIGNGQDTNTLLGKMLRIDVDSAPDVGLNYHIPADNPFVGMGGFREEIYALGLRNPWRWSFDSGGSNRLFLGDVGQGSIEEVDIIVSGGNYGWRRMEGSQCFNPGSGCQTRQPLAPHRRIPQRRLRVRRHGRLRLPGQHVPADCRQLLLRRLLLGQNLDARRDRARCLGEQPDSRLFAFYHVFRRG
jgi:hypothetical protein